MSETGGNNHNGDESSAFFANNDASSYNTRYLKSIRNKERFQELHFYQCGMELIDELFPKQAQKGTLDPPAAYRASAISLGQWRELDQKEQSIVLKKEKQGGNLKEDDAGNGLKRSVEAPGEQATSAPPASKVLKTAEDPGDSVPGHWDSTAHELDVDFCKDRICRGLSLDFLKKSFPSQTSKLEGFAALVGAAMQYKAQAYKNGHSWPFALDPRVVGTVVEELPSESEKSVILLKWICVQLGEGEAPTNRTKLDSVSFHHPTCIRASPSMLCDNCKGNGTNLINSCAGYGEAAAPTTG